jgi:hypothetical protein
VSFLLDTNIMSEHLRRPAGLIHRFVQHSGRLYTSSISLAELYGWANSRKDPAPSLAAIHRRHYLHGNRAGTGQPVTSGRTIDQKSRTLLLTVSVSMPRTL